MKLKIMETLLRILVIVFSAVICAAKADDSDETMPIRVGQNWQLFLDNYVIDRGTGFDRVVHHPRPMGLVIPADKPWETAGAIPLFIARKKDGAFFAFYEALWYDTTPEFKISRDRAHDFTEAQ